MVELKKSLMLAADLLDRMIHQHIYDSICIDPGRFQTVSYPLLTGKKFHSELNCSCLCEDIVSVSANGCPLIGAAYYVTNTGRSSH